MVIVLSNRDCLVYHWLYNGSDNYMNITQLEKEIIKAIKIEAKEIKLLTDKHNEDGEYLKDLTKFVKKCFKEHNQE